MFRSIVFSAFRFGSLVDVTYVPNGIGQVYCYFSSMERARKFARRWGKGCHPRGDGRFFVIVYCERFPNWESFKVRGLKQLIQQLAKFL